MKYTLLVTRQCNLRCPYCYIGKYNDYMSPAVAEKIIDFSYERTPPGERIDFGFFGGEPLLAFDVIQHLTEFIESHPSYAPENTHLTIVSNGTIFSDKIASFIKNHNIGFGISCDGPPSTQDKFRPYVDGGGSSGKVEETIRKALDALSFVMVNAVYQPSTLQALPATVEYLSSLGVRQIYLNPDYSANWTQQDLDSLERVYGELGRIYTKYYNENRPHYISLIDGKITMILRDGYHQSERCSMGKGELAFTPDGNIYPCERLVGEGDDDHCIGNIETGLEAGRMSCHQAPETSVNVACITCSLKDHCMNWCGCSNYFGSGYYNRAAPFLCASEKALIKTAANILDTLEKSDGKAFFEHAAGFPLTNSVRQMTACRGD